MPEYNTQSDYSEQTRVRDLEERQRLLKDRILLIGKTVVSDRDKNFKDIQEMKSSLLGLKEDVARIKELIQRMSEQLNQTARKEEVMIIQRQLDLLRK